MSDHDPYASHQRVMQPGGYQPDQHERPPYDPSWPQYGPAPVGPTPTPEPQGSAPRYLKKRWYVFASGFVVVLIAIAAVASSGDRDQGNDDAGDQATANSTQSDGDGDGDGDGQEVFAIGQTAHTGDLDVTVHTVQDPFTPTNPLETPPAGQRFVAVEATVTNTGPGPLPFSTLAGLELFDQLDRPWTTALAGTDLPQLDAPTVVPGEARRGWVVFAVPPDATNLRIRIKGNITANGSLFQLT